MGLTCLMLSQPLRPLYKLRTSLLSDLERTHSLSDCLYKAVRECAKSPGGKKRSMHLCQGAGHEGWTVGGEEEDVDGEIRVTLFGLPSPRPSISLTDFCVRLQMKVGKAPGEGWGFTATLLLAFVFGDPLYLRARPLSI